MLSRHTVAILIRGNYDGFITTYMQLTKYTVEELRKKYPRFVYESFAWSLAGDSLKAAFQFKAEPDLLFNPEITIHSIKRSRIDSLNNECLDNLVFHLGLVEVMSYWKATCSPQILIQAGSLSDEQIEWWHDLLLKGMGEYFFVNNINFKRPAFISIVGNKDHGHRWARCDEVSPQGRNLILTSGGKDTALTLAMLRDAHQASASLLLNPARAALDLASTLSDGEQIIVNRSIDPTLLELNRRGYLNGHTPFSAYLAFLGVACAVLFRYARVIVSNERSSDEGNVEFLGGEINHQYSKTLRFERRFQEYTSKYLVSSVDYFSFLRPLYDFQITRMLTQYPEALSLFKSCNRNQRENSWCGRCPKCVSVYVMLYPFVEHETILRTYGEDPFEQESIISIIQELSGVSGHKPFECVGTRRETIAALYLGLRRAKTQCAELPLVWRYVEEHVLPKYTHAQDLVPEILLAWSDNHTLPKDYEAILREGFTQSVCGHTTNEAY
jgi:hypothetical protein